MTTIPFTLTTNILTLAVALAAGLITGAVTYWVLRGQRFPAPGIIAGAVAGLGVLGILRTGEGVVAVILLPYAALGLSLLALLILAALAKLSRRWRSWADRRRHRHARLREPSPPARGRSARLSAALSKITGRDNINAEPERLPDTSEPRRSPGNANPPKRP
jgi:hypothetical protein